MLSPLLLVVALPAAAGGGGSGGLGRDYEYVSAPEVYTRQFAAIAACGRVCGARVWCVV